MRYCHMQQEKRRVAAHWIEQCQRKHMIHGIGQCQSRSPEYTRFGTLSEGIQFYCLVAPSPVSSASVCLSDSFQDSSGCRRQCHCVYFLF